MTGLGDVGIDGACFLPLKVIPAGGGPVLHLLKPGNALFPDFPAGVGEIYFSQVLPGQVKAWKRHRLQTQHFAVPVGELSLVLYDSREDSASHGALCELTLGQPDYYGLLRIPCGVWYGFAARGGTAALVCNVADIAHDPDEGERMPHDSAHIPYTWSV